jgi:hypothetical protein
MIFNKKLVKKSGDEKEEENRQKKYLKLLKKLKSRLRV